MSTGIYRRNFLGELDEIPQEHLDYWCKLCQFPFAEGKCKDKNLIQKCWDNSEAIGNRWHIQHECPFILIGKTCHCNDYATIADASRAAVKEIK